MRTLIRAVSEQKCWWFGFSRSDGVDGARRASVNAWWFPAGSRMMVSRKTQVTEGTGTRARPRPARDFRETGPAAVIATPRRPGTDDRPLVTKAPSHGCRHTPLLALTSKGDDVVSLDPTSLDLEPIMAREVIESVFVDHLAETAIRAAGLISHRWALAVPERPTEPIKFETARQARVWLDTKTGVLLDCADHAQAMGEHLTVCRIAESLEAHLRGGGDFQTRVRLLRSGVRSARCAADTVWEARLRNLLGLVLAESGELQAANTELVAALDLAETDGDDRGRASSLRCRGIVAQRDRRDEDALALFDRARSYMGSWAGRKETAALDLSTGRSLVNLGRFDHALEALDGAMGVLSDPDGAGGVDEVEVAAVRSERGRALIAKRRTDEARVELELALEGFAAHEKITRMARVRELLAGLGQLVGETDWRRHLVEAARLHEEAGDDGAAERARRHL